jgi:hypothetical protein
MKLTIIYHFKKIFKGKVMENNKTFQNKRIKSKILILLPILFFLSCGGGGGSTSQNSPENNTSDNTQPTEPNNSLIVKAGLDMTVFSNEGVTLNAIIVDDNKSKLTYKWFQLEGDSINLTNNSFKQLTFIAPIVEGNVSLMFKVEVTDNKGVSSSDEIVIKVIKVSKEDNRQEVLALNNPIKASGLTISVPFSYNIYPSTLLTTGLSLRIYWNNNKLELIDIKEAFTTDYLKYSVAQADLLNRDNDTTTTHYTTISWLNIKEGKWVTPNLPLKLMTPTFRVLDKINGSSYINIRSAFESPKVNFYSKSVLIEF